MADITCTSTGKTFWRIDDGVAALLLDALPSVFVRAVPHTQPAPAPAEPRWSVGIDGGGHPVIKYTVGAQATHYGGPPDKAASGFKTLVWNAEKQARVLEGPLPPEHIVEEYRRRYVGEATTFLPAVYHQTAFGVGEK